MTHLLLMAVFMAFGWGCFVSRSLSMKALTKVRRFLVSEDGPTAVEYAVMLALILVACITIVTTLGTSVSGTFSRVNASMSS
jgi:pilus assembly protein Flp/PilA